MNAIQPSDYFAAVEARQEAAFARPPRVAPPRVLYYCPECGAACGSARHLGTHRYRSHGVRGRS